MKQTLRLSIPTPCSENWDRMTPVERGRHCQQCCKTVVDFTGMSDGEVFGFFKDRLAGSGGVCGRFAGDQLGRELAPAPVQRNGWKGWQLVVAGALVLGKGPDVGRQTTAGIVSERPDTSEPVVVGKPAPKVLIEMLVVQGAPAMTTITTTTGMVGSDDTVVPMPVDTVRAEAVKRQYGLTGAVRIIGDTILCTRKSESDLAVVALEGRVGGIAVQVDTASWGRRVADTVGALMKGTIDSVAGLVGLRPDIVTVYPNPVMRGAMIQMKWDAPAGTYSAALLGLHGQTLQERILEVAGKGQVDEWALPGGLAAGVYFLRVARPGDKAVTKEILVQ